MKRVPKKYLYEVLTAFGILAIVALLISFISPYTPQKTYSFYESESTSSITHFRASVKNVTQDRVTVTLLDGPNKGSDVIVETDRQTNQKATQPGTIVLVSNFGSGQGLVFNTIYRLPLLLVLIASFVIAVLLIGRRKGLMSLVGLGTSIIVILWGIIPLVINGYNSLLVTVAGAVVIAIVSLLIAHGFHRRTVISISCVLVILTLVTIVAQSAVALLGLTGIVDEVGFYLKLNSPEIDMSGILVGGIIIAALGALDDIVTTQVAVVDQLKKANPTLNVYSLFKKASVVGGEHIAALVNTLALVYVGAALPLIVAYSLSSPEVIQFLNSEFIATEIVRTVAVSLGMIISVPLSTFIAAYVLHTYGGRALTLRRKRPS